MKGTSKRNKKGEKTSPLEECTRFFKKIEGKKRRNPKERRRGECFS